MSRALLLATALATFGVFRPAQAVAREEPKEPKEPEISEERYSEIMRACLPPSRQERRAKEREAAKAVKRMARRKRI